MKQVMQKAQELAQAIAESDTYLKMKALEEKVQSDPVSNGLLNTMMQTRSRVEDLLSSSHMDQEELKAESKKLEEAEKNLNNNPDILELKAARKDFSVMMENVNRILRLVITGEVQEDDFQNTGCGGNCSACGGCL